MTANNGPAHLYRNEGGNANNALRITTAGTASNRDGIGARIELTVAGGAKRWQIVKTGSSYASQSDRMLTFGLGSDAVVSSIEVDWPSGVKDKATNVMARQFVTFEEGKGLTPSDSREAQNERKRRSRRKFKSDEPSPSEWPSL